MTALFGLVNRRHIFLLKPQVVKRNTTVNDLNVSQCHYVKH